MKNRRLISVIAIAVFALLTGSMGLSAQDDAAKAKKTVSASEKQSHFRRRRPEPVSHQREPLLAGTRSELYSSF